MAAVDAVVHTVSARRGMDATFLEYWQLLAEMGAARYVAVHDLGPVTLDVNEAAAIASRVLEEDVHPITMPLLDDDESVIGVLDVVSGEQWLGGAVEPPRSDFTEAVEAKANVLLDESGGEVWPAVLAGEFAVAVTVDTRSRAGVAWLAAHLPEARCPAASTVLPGDEAGRPFVRAGMEPLEVGRALAIAGTSTSYIAITALSDVLSPRLRERLESGQVAACAAAPVPDVGSLLAMRS
jgi:hypothetical protein